MLFKIKEVNGTKKYAAHTISQKKAKHHRLQLHLTIKFSFQRKCYDDINTFNTLNFIYRVWNCFLKPTLLQI